jgi:hypothetical protein
MQSRCRPFLARSADGLYGDERSDLNRSDPESLGDFIFADVKCTGSEHSNHYPSERVSVLLNALDLIHPGMPPLTFCGF